MNPVEVAAQALLASQADRDVIVCSAEISRDLHAKFTTELRANASHEKCTLLLTTYGGDPHGGYRIARCIRHHYKHVRLVVPSACKSAGTLIAIAADELAIGDLGELGPLDIQVSKPSEFLERGSGLDIIQALQMVQQHTQHAFMQSMTDMRQRRLSTKMAGEFASKIAVGVAEPLYAQIDPNRLGEMQRAMRITHDYGQRLDKYTSILLPRALDRLVAGYPSHSFVIDRKEAKELFRLVNAPTGEEESFVNAMWELLATETDFGPVVVKAPPQGGANGQGQADQGNHPPAPAGGGEAVPAAG